MKLVPFAVIQEAKKFDTEAVEFVFRHFAGFIASKCQRHYPIYSANRAGKQM